MCKRLEPAIALLFSLAACLMGQGAPAYGQTPSQELTRSQVRLFNANSEVIEGAFPGMLLVPKSTPTYRDEKYQRRYRLACHVYAASPSRTGDSEPVYRRRFLVCAPDQDALPFTKQVARLLLLLYGERHDRIRDDHPENLPTVNVWLTDRVEPGLSPDTGGEQFQNQIYLYNIHRERSEIEWAREIAHEYGHYALPGIAGFKAPEEWANGVLGERLFLKWIRDDVKGGRLKSEDLPFVNSGLLDEFYAHSVWPLIRRIMANGTDGQLITNMSEKGMDYYTGLAMYIDTLYGTPTLVNAMVDTQSASSLTFPRASDFLTGVLTALRGENEITLNLPALGEVEMENTIRFFLPAGGWNVTMEGGVLSWRVPADPKLGVSSTSRQITTRRPGWVTLTYLRSRDRALAARLTFRKRG